MSLENVYILEESDFSFSDDKEAELIGFQKLGMPNKPAVVLIFASWCGHCKTFKPEYQKFANLVKQIGEPVYICAIEADGSAQGQPELAKKLKNISKEFRGFPDCYLYKGGKIAARFNGPRTLEGLKEFIGM